MSVGRRNDDGSKTCRRIQDSSPCPPCLRGENPRYHWPMPSIHPTASVSRDAVLAESVEIGPFCILDGPIRLSDGVRLLGNNYHSGPVSIGEGTIVYPFACIGSPPQDVKFKPGDRTAGVVIGK